MKETILIVDDQPDLVNAIRLTLEVAGYVVYDASNGIDALAILRKYVVDLVLTDIAMPRMNGYQLYEAVCANPEWVAMPFIFLTARTLDSDIRYGKQLGVDDYLTKPIQPEDLLAVVEGKLRRVQLQHTTMPPQSVVAPPPLPSTDIDSICVIGALHIDREHYRVWMHGEPVQLSVREFTLLDYMAQHLDVVLSQQDLVRVTHQIDTDAEDAGTLLRPLIRSLRRKLGYNVGETGCIEVIRSMGYRLTTPM